MSSVEVHVPFIKKWKKKIKKEVKPRTAKPATQPHGSTTKETFNACGKLVRAACVVLTFVLLQFSFHIPCKS
jgi:hypothetical protein